MRQKILFILQIGGCFGLPLVVIVTFGWMAYDQFIPWPLADELVPIREGQTRLLVGSGYSSRSTYAAPGRVSERTADYVYFPEVSKTREMYRLVRRNDEKPSVSTASFSLVSYVVGLLVAVGLTIAAWRFPLARRGSS